MTKSFQRALNRGFCVLDRRGYFAQQNWKCCQTCGCAAVPNEFEQRYVFYHAQDADRLLEEDRVYLAWAGDGEEIVNVFTALGLIAEWDGTKRFKS